MARKKKEENIEVTTATEEAKEAGVTADGAPEESAEAAAAEEAPKLEFKKPSKAERPHGVIMTARITFVEEVLGSAPNNPDIYRDFTASKAPNAESREEEIASIGADEATDKMKTVFPRELDKDGSPTGAPFVYDYTFKGLLKDSCGLLQRIPGTESSKIKAYKKVINGLIFPGPRKIFFYDADGNLIENVDDECQRPLRAQTAQGDRECLAISDVIPSGTSCDVDFCILDYRLLPFVEECLNYGILHGFGQWRNSGKVRFIWEKVDERAVTYDEAIQFAKENAGLVKVR